MGVRRLARLEDDDEDEGAGETERDIGGERMFSIARSAAERTGRGAAMDTAAIGCYVVVDVEDERVTDNAGGRSIPGNISCLTLGGQ